jgi:hypothetical protein
VDAARTTGSHYNPLDPPTDPEVASSKGPYGRREAVGDPAGFYPLPITPRTVSEPPRPQREFGGAELTGSGRGGFDTAG